MDEETKRHNVDLVTKIESVCINKGSCENNMDQKNCRSVSARVNNYNRENNQEHARSRLGSACAKKDSGKNITNIICSKLALALAKLTQH